jgi:hypothetical protein
LDYRLYRQLKNEGGIFRFTGGIESITDGHTLWVKGEDLTVPVSLEKTKCFLLPEYEGEGIPEPPEQIRWNRVSTLTEGVKVYIGGQIKMQNNRLNFTSEKEAPLIVIFYSCPEEELTSQIIRAARTHNEYWNSLTPVSLLIGALFLVYIAASLLNRPAFRINVISALVAVFIPILPIIPPGILLTTIYRRITWYAKRYKANWDLANLPVYNGDSSLPSEKHDRRYAIKVYIMQTSAWLILFLGVSLNFFFIIFIISLLGGIH